MKISRVALFLRGTFNKKSRETGSSKSLVWGKKTCSRFIGNTPSVTSRANLLNGKLKGFLSFKTAKIFYFSFSFFFSSFEDIGQIRQTRRIHPVVSIRLKIVTFYIYIYIRLVAPRNGENIELAEAIFLGWEAHKQSIKPVQ